MGQLSLPKNLAQGVSHEELCFQVGELVDKLENYLNHKVDIFLVNSVLQANKVLESLKQGDLVFDFKIPGVATLQQWDGKRFITFNLANLEGSIDLIAQGIGSGDDPTLYLRSDGDGGWVLDSPSQQDTAQVVATEDLSEFRLVTANGKIADSSNSAHFNHVVGISTIFVPSGNVANVIVEGEVTNPAWTWVNNDKLFLNGTSLSTVAPSSGFVQFIAIAKNSQTIHVRIQIPILL